MSIINNYIEKINNNYFNKRSLKQLFKNFSSDPLIFSNLHL